MFPIARGAEVEDSAASFKPPNQFHVLLPAGEKLSLSADSHEDKEAWIQVRHRVLRICERCCIHSRCCPQELRKAAAAAAAAVAAAASTDKTESASSESASGETDGAAKSKRPSENPLTGAFGSMSAVIATTGKSTLSKPAVSRSSRSLEMPDAPNCCKKLSRKQRIKGFLACVALGWLLSITGSLLFWTAGTMAKKAKAFAVLFFMGNIVLLLGSMFLIGPKRQCKTMLKPVRRKSCILYFTLLILIFVLALVVSCPTWCRPSLAQVF